MQALSASVGEGGTNALHDVALVQASLVLATRPAFLDSAKPTYLASYDGACGQITKQAIRAFQSDVVFVSPDGTSSRPVPNATPGLIQPGDVTWQKLVAAVPIDRQDLRALASTKVVYIAATAADRLASRSAIVDLTFEASFRVKLLNLVDRIFGASGIVVTVCPQGARRTFQEQYALLTGGTGVTNAGPGESNHNFGQAVDLGFNRLRWLKTDATVVENEDWWLHKMDQYAQFGNQSSWFWNMLRTEGTSGTIGLFRGPVADRPHLQAWNDQGIDMAARLADLLTRVGTMRWTGQAQRYRCDLGYGGAYVDVGRAAQIWSGQATLTAASIAGASSRPLNQIKPDEIETMRTRLVRDFQAADTGWQSWRPQ